VCVFVCVCVCVCVCVLENAGMVVVARGVGGMGLWEGGEGN